MAAYSLDFYRKALDRMGIVSLVEAEAAASRDKIFVPLRCPPRQPQDWTRHGVAVVYGAKDPAPATPVITLSLFFNPERQVC